MKKLQLSFIGASVLLAASMAFAGQAEHQSYKGEVPCPPQLMLMDGLYIGAAVGYDSYRIRNDAVFVATPTTFISYDPVLNAAGLVGGGFLGFGHYFPSFYNTYLGFELFGNASDAGTDAQAVVTAISLASVEYSTHIHVRSNYGLSLLPGIKLNNATLLYIRLGYNWSNIDVDDYVLVNNGLALNSIYDVTSSGFNYGIGLETAIRPHVSLRAEFTHTDYSDFTTYLDTHISPADNQFMLGLVLHM
jgi:opacity protein-like surface antigen